MEAMYKTRDGRLTIKVEGETQKDIFGELARAQETFEAETQCGLCQGTELRFSVRTSAEIEFFELRCSGCGAQLSYGQRKVGGSLYPKRQGGNGGWSKWEPTEGERR